MKKTIKQAGFSPVVVLLIIILVGIIGFTGLYVYNATKNNSKTMDSMNDSTIISKPKASPTVPAKTLSNNYSNGTYKFSLVIPSDAVLKETKPESINIKSSDNKYSIDMYIGPKGTGGRGYEEAKRYVAYNPTFKSGSITINKVTDTTNDGLPMADGTMSTHGYAVLAWFDYGANSYVISLVGADEAQSSGGVSFFEEVLKTLKFN